jgi:hypothetical protein
MNALNIAVQISMTSTVSRRQIICTLKIIIVWYQQHGRFCTQTWLITYGCCSGLETDLFIRNRLIYIGDFFTLIVCYYCVDADIAV